MPARSEGPPPMSRTDELKILYEPQASQVRNRLSLIDDEVRSRKLGVINASFPGMIQDAHKLIQLSDGILPWEGGFVTKESPAGKEVEELMTKYGTETSLEENQRPDKTWVSEYTNCFLDACELLEAEYTRREKQAERTS